MPFHRAIRVVLLASLAAACGVPPPPPDVTGPPRTDAGAGPPTPPPPDPSPCHCTRRPGPGTSFRCPAGADEQASALIGPAGGVVELSGQQGRGVPFSLKIPPRALAAPRRITVTETSTPPPADFIDFSPIYRVDPIDLALTVPGEWQVPWGNFEGDTPRDLALYWSPSGAPTSFTRLPDSFVNAGFNQASARNGGFLFVGAPKGARHAHCP